MDHYFQIVVSISIFLHLIELCHRMGKLKFMRRLRKLLRILSKYFLSWLFVFVPFLCGFSFISLNLLNSSHYSFTDLPSSIESNLIMGTLSPAQLRKTYENSNSNYTTISVLTLLFSYGNLVICMNFLIAFIVDAYNVSVHQTRSKIK